MRLLIAYNFRSEKSVAWKNGESKRKRIFLLKNHPNFRVVFIGGCCQTRFCNSPSDAGGYFFFFFRLINKANIVIKTVPKKPTITAANDIFEYLFIFCPTLFITDYCLLGLSPNTIPTAISLFWSNLLKIFSA